jgi:NADH-quinone oxidoreductase subunit G
MSQVKRVALTIDGRKVVVDEGTSLLQAAALNGIAIPHFCYHPGLQVEGSCRMCLVEIEGLPKLELSCSNPARENQVVWTANERVRQARRDVLEFLLAEHPLDCPICDKAGECRLQDYYDLYGRFPGRMAEPRDRRTKKTPIGRGLILDRERCVLCTRCVRFLRQVTGTGELGVFERGLGSEIGTFPEAPVDNNYSGNLVDVCPVGAITAEDFRFRTRAWFLKKRPSVCPHCGRGCAVVVESVKGYPLAPGERRVYRITAGENPAANGFWICDLGRDGRHDIDERRQTRILRRGRPVPEASWPQAVAEIADRIRAVPGPERASRIAVVLNSRLTCEELDLARRLFLDGLGLPRVSFADRKPGAADALLMTAERVPNLRGARGAGFEPRLPVLHELATSKIALVFGSGLGAHFPEEALAGALAEIPAKYFFAAHAGPLDSLADIVVPVTVPPEKSGTYINVDGLRQSFACAVARLPGTVDEGTILRSLADALGLSAGVADAR